MAEQSEVRCVEMMKRAPRLLLTTGAHRTIAKCDETSRYRTELWAAAFTTDATVLTAGVAVADLSNDGIPEIVFATYSTDEGKSSLFILDASGKERHKISLPRRGSMAVPTIGDVDGNGILEIVVSLKDADDKVESLLVNTVANLSPNCLLWPTGRGNSLRSAWVRD